MKPLLVLFMLCGNPYYIVGHDEYGFFAGFYDIPAPIRVRSRLLEMYRNPQTLKIKQNVDDVLGGVCV